MTALSRTRPFGAPLDHAGFTELFQRRHQGDLDRIEADLIARARRLDADDQLDDAAVDALAAESRRRVDALIDTFTTAFIASAINSALALEKAAQ